MNLFSADLFRLFGVGFVAGTLMLGAATVDQWGPHIESPAQAAAPLQAPAPSAEFLIEPFDASE